MKKLKWIIIIFLVVVITLSYLYGRNFYEAKPICDKYLQSTDKINVIEEKKYIFFDSEEANRALIFYPDSRVEAKSYAKLMHKFAQKGFDVFLLKFPCRMPSLGTNYPNKIISKYNYDEVYLGGHSNGGVVAANYLFKTNKNINGIIFLASYSNYKIKNDIKIISIYGENDRVLDIEKYNELKNNYNDNFKEFIIKGGNHSGFANYGRYKKDGYASITSNWQQNRTVKLVNKTIGNKTSKIKIINRKN